MKVKPEHLIKCNDVYVDFFKYIINHLIFFSFDVVVQNPLK
jgi:hypothetical protein